MITHSSSTIAIAPPDSRFLCLRKGHKITRISKDRAIQDLTENINSLSILHENRRQVFVEDKIDVIIYELGPSFGFGLGGRNKAGDFEIEFDFDEAGLKSFDLGVSIGAGAQFPVGPGNLFADVRYLLGVITTADAGNANTFNRGLGIAAGFLFPIGGE